MNSTKIFKWKRLFAPQREFGLSWQERDNSLPEGDMTLKKLEGCDTAKIISCNESNWSPWWVNKCSSRVVQFLLARYYHNWKILCKQVLHKCEYSCAWFLNQNGLDSLYLKKKHSPGLNNRIKQVMSTWQKSESFIVVIVWPQSQSQSDRPIWEKICRVHSYTFYCYAHSLTHSLTHTTT